MRKGISVSTHILDSALGGGCSRVTVELIDDRDATVGSGVTDEVGRILELAGGLQPGVFRLHRQVGGAFVVNASVTVNLAEVRHYHVPLLASDYSAAVYLGV